MFSRRGPPLSHTSKYFMSIRISKATCWQWRGASIWLKWSLCDCVRDSILSDNMPYFSCEGNSTSTDQCNMITRENASAAIEAAAKVLEELKNVITEGGYSYEQAEPFLEDSDPNMTRQSVSEYGKRRNELQMYDSGPEEQQGKLRKQLARNESAASAGRPSVKFAKSQLPILHYVKYDSGPEEQQGKLRKQLARNESAASPLPPSVNSFDIKKSDAF
ncbi:hypothetical protein M514_25888 [Trichuris suis]|uniref:Uncharacterized protein n=1 Tax=Trichuris suis TaxID=68888 RepID=A0A085MXJ9_9BILA|nr:hypothetical protein M514_25888 [Trichuris suis]